MVEERLAHAVDDLAQFVSADGAAVHVERIDAEDGLVELSLDLKSVECEACVLPHAMLEDLFTDVLASRMERPVTVVVHDPRVSFTL